MNDKKAVKHNLLDAGCREQTADFVEQLYLAGRLSDLCRTIISGRQALRCTARNEGIPM